MGGRKIWILLQVTCIIGSWEDLLRNWTPEKLEDYPNCGEVQAQNTQDSCLWDCEWRPNPYFKFVDTWTSKVGEDPSAQNRFLLLYLSPRIPKDLKCLSDCFDRYKPGSNWTQLERVRKNCSANGLDRLVGTHSPSGKAFAASNHSNLLRNVILDVLWTNLSFSYTIQTYNPILDCMVYSERELLQDKAIIGNFIADDFGDSGDDADQGRGNILWDKFRYMKPRKGQQKQPEEVDEVNNDALETILLDLGITDQLLNDTLGLDTVTLSDATNILSDIFCFGSRQQSFFGSETNIERFIFRSSDPVKMAIEICTQAKLLSFLKDYAPIQKLCPAYEQPETYVYQNLELFSGETCDQFLPDIFAPLCSCVGTCGDPMYDKINFYPNLITYFYSNDFKKDKPGMWGCQVACQEETRCEFWTLSKVYDERLLYNNQDSDVHRCYLWSKCDEFFIPAGTTINAATPATDQAFSGRPISDHWSGIKNCTDYNHVCPLLTGSTIQFKGTPPWTKKKVKEKKRVLGQSSTAVQPDKQSNKFPWLCSLKEAGFTGKHRCAVTLLSGPESKDVVMVSSAHCNFICKDGDIVVEVCCCRQANLLESCRNTSSYCGKDAQLEAAQPTEMNIVCSENSLQIQPEDRSPEMEVVLSIAKISNSPTYSAGTREDVGEELKGPYAGGDISVYHLTEEAKKKIRGKMEKGVLWPACLPKKKYTQKKGIFAGWLDQEPYYRVTTDRISAYENFYLLRRQIEVEKVKCKDPSWMKSSYNNLGTFYPAATECYRDPSQASCFLFGNSGSGVVRRFTPEGQKPEQYAFTGPLSMSKGCDQISIYDNEISYSAENPGVFTDAYCYLPWIAAEYGLSLPAGFTSKDSCGQSQGNRRNIDQENCYGMDIENLDRGRCKDWMKNPCQTFPQLGLTEIVDDCPFSFTSEKDCLDQIGPNISQTSGGGRQFRRCDFSYTDPTDTTTGKWDQCRLFSEEGYAYNIYTCKDNEGNNMTCANNCRGVHPNSVIVGGIAVLSSGIGALGLLQLGPALGLAGAGVGVVGSRVACTGPLWCTSTRGRCCFVIATNRGLRCPSTC